MHTSRVPLWLFSGTLALSAFLLFSVQLMLAKMVLPTLGGAPAVWNTCFVFFQAVLLAGYGYAHGATRWLGVRRYLFLHAVLLLAPFLWLPIGLPSSWIPPTETPPISRLLMLLGQTVGVPFFFVSTSAPLLQRWFTTLSHPDAKDPYFLYAASNAGSLLGLLAYPFLIEPRFSLTAQSQLWAVAYAALVILTALCALVVRISPAVRQDPARMTPEPPDVLTWSRRGWWVVRALVPSSLLLGVTAYLSTDIASIPLLWVVPLALYLLTFILAFAKRPLIPYELAVRALPFVFIIVATVMVSGQYRPAWLLIILHLLMLFVAGLACHGALAQDRPAPSHLTEFYLWVAVGGAAGGAFNALLAPRIFPALYEYPLAMVLACVMQPGERKRVSRFTGLGIGAVWLAMLLFTPEWSNTVVVRRSFYGIHRVVLNPDGDCYQLVHGTTLHGMQCFGAESRRVPLAYYYPTGPIGDVFGAFAGGTPTLRAVGVIGLGIGATACYGSPGQRWTFYEIDPLVKHLATNPAYFTQLRDCLEQFDLRMGDARLSLALVADQAHDLLIIDAFSSGAVPVHLLTREALALYRAKLSPQGLLAFHISSEYVNLEPVLGNLAAQAGLMCLIRRESAAGMAPEELARGKLPSVWMVLGRKTPVMEALARAAGWRPAQRRPDQPVWTDDYSNLLSVFRWN